MKEVKRIDDGRTPWPRFYLGFVRIPFALGFRLFYHRSLSKTSLMDRILIGRLRRRLDKEAQGVRH